MLRRLCTARETKLQLAVSLARRHPSATEAKITSPECLNASAVRLTPGQLLQEVWGYDYFGGTRTVDVHVRRLRAKLGSEYESMIGTVRQVGYKFVVPPSGRQLPDNEPVSLPV